MNISEQNAWQDAEHAREFDEVSTYPNFLMRRRFEAFNEIRLLCEHMQEIHGDRFFEIGCATGELGRYVEKYLPQFNYTGFDISRPGIERATQKYGSSRYRLLEGPIGTFLERFGLADVVFCRDVIHHQLDSYAFLDSLLAIARETLVLRTRTRDSGDTVFDAERSCQHHYEHHWVPFIVLNINELIERISADPAVSKVVVSRRYEPLGGRNGRYLPKELFYRETGSAETALLVLKGSRRGNGRPEVIFDDRPDGPCYTLFERAYLKLSRSLRQRARQTA